MEIKYITSGEQSDFPEPGCVEISTFNVRESFSLGRLCREFELDAIEFELCCGKNDKNISIRIPLKTI